MDNTTAKEILSAYRPGGEDANDPFFREALAQCEHDPAMKRWFYEQRVFDERVAASLQNIRAPESGKRDQWWRENGYNLIATENAGQLVAIATRASPETIQYLL